MEIKYELAEKTNGIIPCLTHCPHNIIRAKTPVKVGSAGCQICKHYLNEDFENKIVFCNFPETGRPYNV